MCCCPLRPIKLTGIDVLLVPLLAPITFLQLFQIYLQGIARGGFEVRDWGRHGGNAKWLGLDLWVSAYIGIIVGSRYGKAAAAALCKP